MQQADGPPVKPARAVFIDRDGTLNEEVSYLGRFEDLRLIEGAGAGIRLLNEAGFKVVVVTNQSGIARGFFDEKFLDALHGEIERRLRSDGARVDGWYYCPHHPSEGKRPYRRECGCRKPSTGLIERAREKFHIDVKKSFVIGDSMRDIDMALRVGAKPVLVLTGYGEETFSSLYAHRKKSLVHVAPDLYRACRWICEFSL